MLGLLGASDCPYTAGKLIKIWRKDIQAKIQPLLSDENKTESALFGPAKWMKAGLKSI